MGTGVIFINTSPYVFPVDNYAFHCVRVKTQNNVDAAGEVSLAVDLGSGYVSQLNQHYFAKKAKWEKCFDVFIVAVQISTTSTSDHWRGAIEHSTDGGYAYTEMRCSDCQLGEYTDDIGLKNAGSTVGNTRCLNGGPCKLVPISGTTTTTTVVHTLQKYVNAVHGWLYLGHYAMQVSFLAIPSVDAKWHVDRV